MNDPDWEELLSKWDRVNNAILRISVSTPGSIGAAIDELMTAREAMCREAFAFARNMMRQEISMAGGGGGHE